MCGVTFTNPDPLGNGCDTTHAYSNLGVFRVKLKVSPSQNQQFRDIGVRSNTDGQADLTPDFSWTPPNPTPGQPVTFNDQTDGITYTGNVSGNTLTESTAGFVSVYARQ